MRSSHSQGSTSRSEKGSSQGYVDRVRGTAGRARQLLRDNERSLGLAVAQKASRQIARGCLRLLPNELYWEVASRYYRWHVSRDIDAYNVVTDPFRILWIDPDRIVYHSNREYPPWTGRSSPKTLCGRVANGDWDIPTSEYYHPPRFEDRSEFKAIRAHFVDGVPWEETAYIRQKIEEVEHGDDSRYGTTRAEILANWRAYDDLYDEIAENGYASQRELVVRGIEPKRFLKAINSEVAVDLSRNGEPLFVDGSHRLSIAKVLGLNKIPVIVYYRHKQWMNVREEIHAADADNLSDRAKRLLDSDHPDLRDLGADVRPDV